MVPKFSVSSPPGEPKMKIIVAKATVKRPESDWSYEVDASYATYQDSVSNGANRNAPNIAFEAAYEINDDLPGYETFVIGKKMLEATSPYFTALNNFKEGAEGVVVLDETTAECFSIFSDWICTGERDWTNPSHNDLDTLVNAYVLGRRLMIPRFQNFVMDEIREFDTNNQINVQKLLDLHNLGFTKADPITKYFIDRIAYQAILTDFWSLNLPSSMRDQDEEFVDQEAGLLMVSVMERVAEMMRELRFFTPSTEYIDPKENLVDPKSDKNKSYHIVQVN